MRFVVSVMLAAGAAFGQSGGAGQPDGSNPAITQLPNGNSMYLCKLVTVTWNPETKELGWVVSMQSLATGADTSQIQVKYTIHLDTAIMHAKDEDRKLDQDDAHFVDQLLTYVTAYTVDSTVQWSKGLGEKVTGTQAVPAKTVSPEARSATRSATVCAR